jgi:hypothetical protein
MRETRNTCKIFVGKRSLEIPTRIVEDNIKIGQKDLCCDTINWSQLVKDRNE